MKSFRYRRFKPYQNLLGFGVGIGCAGWAVASPFPGLVLVPLAVLGYAGWTLSRERDVLIEIDETSLTYRHGGRMVTLRATDPVRLESASSEPGTETDVYLATEEGRVPINERFENFEDLFREVQRLWPHLPNLFTAYP